MKHRNTIGGNSLEANHRKNSEKCAIKEKNFVDAIEATFRVVVSILEYNVLRFYKFNNFVKIIIFLIFMADSKYPSIRYKTLDQCFRNKYKRYYINDLIDACSEAIYNYSGTDYGCSRRTILNDINFMESSDGWMIDLVRHKDGHKVYYRYRNTNFSIYSSQLSDDELNKFNETMMILEKFKGMPCFEWMDDLLFKLQNGLRPSSDTILEFEQAPSLKGMEHMDKLFNYILHKQVIEVTYTTYGGKKYLWVIHPYRIKQYNNRWFLFGRNDSRQGKISNIPLDRIEAIAECGTSYVPDNGTVQQTLNNIVGVTFNPDAQPEQIQLKFSSSRFPYVLTKPIHKSQKVISEENFTIQIEVIPNKELEAQILQFGSDVKVISPEGFRKQIKEKINKMTENYQ